MAVERPRKTENFAKEMDAKIEKADAEIAAISTGVSEKKQDLGRRFDRLCSTVAESPPRFFSKISELLSDLNAADKPSNGVHPPNGTHPPTQDDAA